jgi:uncharacterized protein (TIGR02271 family)
MTNAASPEVYVGRTVVDQQGNKVGTVGQVYVNDQTAEPDWISINTGLFGMRESFAPLAGSSFDGDNLVVPFDKDVVKDAPDVTDSDHMDADEQQRLYSYYGQYVTFAGFGTSGTRQDADFSARTDAGFGDTDVRGTVGRDTSGPTTDSAMTRSEEQLRVGTEQVETGRARLRKYVVTEQESVQVPVTREEVRIEREPITDANRDAALSGPEISEEEHEVVLHEERPVVQTEAVPVERVRLDTDTVTEDRTVTEDVRKERIDVDDATTGGTTGGTTGATR